jgi:negative regulator of sigma-B (phosphoserine phosphatase)
MSADRSVMRPKSSLALVRGVAGHELPSVRITTLDMSPGDILVLATDGIEAGVGESLDVSGSPRAITEPIVAEHWKPTDDALVVAVRYLAPPR